MSNGDFSAFAHAKCVLSGEHAVLRGHPALVLPLSERGMSLSYVASDTPAKLEVDSPYGETFMLFFWDTIKRALSMCGKDLATVRGSFVITNNIPIGSGLGFSSALCVLISKWLIWQENLKEERIFHMARELEDSFHGKSSGLDIVGALTKKLVLFQRANGLQVSSVKCHWQPKLYLSYSGSMKNTGAAIKKVDKFMQNDLELAKVVDLRMSESVRLVVQALGEDDSKGFSTLKAALDMANQCFTEWGLVTPELQSHMDELKKLGAIAVKPTGAGEGGYVISLWEREPQSTGAIEVIPVLV